MTQIARHATRFLNKIPQASFSSSKYKWDQTTSTSQQLGSNYISKTPSVTLFLRKDHYLFAGDDGKRRLNGLFESYRYARTEKGKTRLSVPFYLPHVIGLQDFKLNYGPTFVPGDVYAQSCFSLLIDSSVGKGSGDEHLLVSTVSDSIWPNVERKTDATSSNNSTSSYYRCYIETHITNTNVLTSNVTEMCSFVNGHDGMRIPERTIIDKFFITNGQGDEKLFAIPFRFDVSVATDRELGIDDEWGMIKKWAQTQS